MARIIVLDSGPLGVACDRRGKPDVERFVVWRHHVGANGGMIVIPAVADYEVRRELIRANATAGLRRLDQLEQELPLIPVSNAALRRAAELWALARARGQATADDRSLDGDVIVAAQALCYSGEHDQVVVATENVRHIARFIAAQAWEDITP